MAPRAIAVGRAAWRTLGGPGPATCARVTDDRLEQAHQRVAELEATIAQYQQAIRHSRVAIFTLPVAASGALEASHVEMMNTSEVLGNEHAGASIHPDDRLRLDALLRELIAGTRDELELELRVRSAEGLETWRLLRAAAVRDHGKTIRIAGTGVDVTKLKNAERQLREATQVAETANLAKDEFLANVSHEIRTPMNAILGMTELVLDTTLAEPQRRSLLTVRSAARGLLDMINDLLDFSKIQAGQTVLDEAPFGLRAALGDTMRALATRAHRKGLELVYDVSSAVPDSLFGDSGRIRQVVLNLVGNAIKFTERGEVVVGVELAEPVTSDRIALRIAVRDTGIGIAESKFAAIFRAFEQEDMSTTRRYGGTGLGLTIASRLVALMHGAIRVESKIGHGSTFTCTMVVAPGPVTEERAAAPVEELRGLRVLIVDDNAVNRHILETWLRASNLVPTSVGDGIAAMDALWHAVSSGAPYPVVLLDSRMPDTDGVALAAKIRERAELAASRIIVLSSGDRPGELERFRELGVEAHLLKPVPHEELIEAIRMVMTRPRSEPPPRPQETVRRPQAAARRILVAEDNEFNADLLVQLLRKRNYDVRHVTSGRKALERLDGEHFDALILDLHMPEVDGFQVVQAIRHRERGTMQHLPVIALTARARAEDRERCLAAGMDAFVAKPVEASDLWQLLERFGSGVLTISRPFDAELVLAACGEDPDILARILARLVALAPNDLAALRSTLAVGDAPALQSVAHKARSMFSTFSAAAGAAAAAIEDAAERGDLASAYEPVERLNGLVEEMLQAAPSLTIEDLLRQAAHRDDAR